MRLATANFDATATMWDAVSGKELFTLDDKSQNGLGFVAFSQDGTHLALADVESVRVYLTLVEDLVKLAKSHVTRSRRKNAEPICTSSRARHRANGQQP